MTLLLSHLHLIIWIAVSSENILNCILRSWFIHSWSFQRWLALTYITWCKRRRGNGNIMKRASKISTTSNLRGTSSIAVNFTWQFTPPPNKFLIVSTCNIMQMEKYCSRVSLTSAFIYVLLLWALCQLHSLFFCAVLNHKVHEVTCETNHEWSKIVKIKRRTWLGGLWRIKHERTKRALPGRVIIKTNIMFRSKLHTRAWNDINFNFMTSFPCVHEKLCRHAVKRHSLYCLLP